MIDRTEHVITDDLHAIIGALPPRIAAVIEDKSGESDLLEIVMDLGREPSIRYRSGERRLTGTLVSQEDIDFVIAHIGDFGEDNRAGIERTLHRISAIRNRKGRVIGLTCRVGRAVYGTIAIIRDIIESGQSILLLGRPGVGKTTMLREVARVLADEFHKRVVIVDTSNEIAGDGDIPHPGIGGARRMQVPTPASQHAVMIEAVENHMPEVIVIDEIGTELEAQAARTIAERGVQLVGTAHGNTLDNLMQNPTLSDLIGGIQTVTLGDEEARRRGTQKSVLERKAPPTFDVVVEIQDWYHVTVHNDVAATVDALLLGRPVSAQVRTRADDGSVAVRERAPQRDEHDLIARNGLALANGGPIVPRVTDDAGMQPLRIYPFGISRPKLEQAAREMRLPVSLVREPNEADLVLTLKPYFRRKPQLLRDAEAAGTPIHVLKNNTGGQMQTALAGMYNIEPPNVAAKGADSQAVALQEAEDAINQVMEGSPAVDLTPQNPYIRRLQHRLAERYNLTSRSYGREPYRRVRIVAPGVEAP
ncbi:MAG TPA: R3H domain-containing nucleic acid-binding protein [Chloroflexota bacterium]|nr:R3H domain-containing nucleic acid-binding protein [Chloroflexota bacterium]